jgi:hypothetical protein
MLDTNIASSNYILSYQVVTNGQITAEEVISSYTEIPPLETVSITFPNVVVGSGDEVYFNLIFTYANDNLYAKKGDIFAQEQFILSNGSPKIPTIDNGSALSISNSSSNYYEVKGTNSRTSKSFVVRVNKTSGLLCHYESGGVVLINGNVVPDFWRV